MVKGVSFKGEKEKDMIEFIKDKDFSYYVKGLIKRDMQENEPRELIKNNKRSTNFDI